MTQRPILLTLTTFIASALWGACGGGGSAAPTPTPVIPTVASVVITGGNAVPSSSTLSTTTAVTNVSTHPATFVVTFSTAMDTTTTNITSSTTGNITLTCNSGVAQSISITNVDSSDTIFTVTPVAATPQLIGCILTVGTGVKSASDGALASAAVYDFTTSCSSSDPFTNPATIVTATGCWDSLFRTTHWTYSIPSATSGLELTHAVPDHDGDDSGALLKAYGSDNISASMTLTFVSGMVIGTKLNTCALAFLNDILSDGGGTSPTAGLEIGVIGTDTLQVFVHRADQNTDFSTDTRIALGGTISTATPLTLTLTRTGTSTFSASYQYAGGAVTSLAIPLPSTAIPVGNSVNIGPFLSSTFDNNTPTACTLSNFTTDGNAIAPNPTAGTTAVQD